MGSGRRRGRPRAALVRADAVRIVWTTVPPRSARAIARTLVKERLAACVAVAPGIRSTYRWKGKLENARETLLSIKADARDVSALIARLVEIHPYEVPEVLVVRPQAGLPSYVRWVQASGGGGRA